MGHKTNKKDRVCIEAEKFMFRVPFPAGGSLKQGRRDKP